MKKPIILLIFLNCCYMSYTTEDEMAEETIADSYTVIETDSSKQIEAVDIDSAVVDIEKETSPTESKSEIREQILPKPILYEVVPKDGCINKDIEIYIVGMFIHWRSTLKIKYKLDKKYTTIDRNLVDECNRKLIDWVDISMISFRTRDDLILNDEYGFVPGSYTLMIINPDGKKSNEIGLNLQHCGKKVEEIEGCRASNQ